MGTGRKIFRSSIPEEYLRPQGGYGPGGLQIGKSYQRDNDNYSSLIQSLANNL